VLFFDGGVVPIIPMSIEKANHRWHGVLELHAAILLLGMAGLFGKFLALSPASIVFGRAVFASAALGLVMAMMRRPTDSTKKFPWKWVAVTGSLLTTHWITFFQSIQISTVAVGLLTFSSFPLFVTLMEPWFFRERRRLLDLFTALAVVAGLSLIVPSFDLNNNITQGACWGILSGLVYAVLCILNRKLVAVHSALTLTWGQNLAASMFLLPFMLWINEWPNPREILLLAILGIVCTALAHFLFIKSLSYVRAQLASVVTALESVYAIFFAILLLGEKPEMRTLAGGAVILSAVAVATWFRHER
jgi:drug/metabolite transporter (DMT)-like permease